MVEKGKAVLDLQQDKLELEAKVGMMYVLKGGEAGTIA